MVSGAGAGALLWQREVCSRVSRESPSGPGGAAPSLGSQLHSTGGGAESARWLGKGSHGSQFPQSRWVCVGQMDGSKVPSTTFDLGVTLVKWGLSVPLPICFHA